MVVLNRCTNPQYLNASNFYVNLTFTLILPLLNWNRFLHIYTQILIKKR